MAGGSDMSVIAAPDKLWTLEEFLALPDDGVERWVIRGQLRESGFTTEHDMTKRNKFHTFLTSRLSQIIGNWIDTQPEPKGEVFAGEAGVILSHEPFSVVGVDIAVVAAGVPWREDNSTTMIDGVPTVCVEILSPSNTIEEIDCKIREYLRVGVPLVWVVDPQYETVTVYRPDQPPEMFNVRKSLTAEPHLPGFSVPVAKVFKR
jgi:Uma2 family endonuclease